MIYLWCDECGIEAAESADGRWQDGADVACPGCGTEYTVSVGDDGTADLVEAA